METEHKFKGFSEIEFSGFTNYPIDKTKKVWSAKSRIYNVAAPDEVILTVP